MDIRKSMIKNKQKKTEISTQLFLKVNKINAAAMKCSYVLSEKIAWASKPFTDGELRKECLVSAVEIMCLEQRQAFASLSLSGNILSQHVDDRASNLQDKLQEKANSCDFLHSGS